ncbi:MAG: DUF4412 domain-containing protein [Candidatus Aminicenantes bacterium]|nr:DUF4412 domain-containing protein [Candidatus Aminicenantes bacterium]
MKKIIFVIFLVFTFTATSFAGVQWRTRTVTEAEAKGQSNTIIMQVYASGGNVKQVFESVDKENDMFRKGSYWLYQAKDNILYMVNPEEKTYSRLPMNALIQMTGAVGKLVKIKISNPVVKNEKLGSAPVLGYPCRHSRQLVEYDMEVKIAIIKNRSHEKIEKEVWSTPSFKGMAEMGEAFRFRDFKTGIEDLDNLIEKQMKADAELGFPLKMITVNTSVNKKGKSKVTQRQTMEVLSLGSKSLHASFFAVPSGYEEKQMGFGGEEE